MSGIDWETRQKILGVLKESEGRISYEDLEGMGVFKPGDLAEGGFKRWLQEHDIGGPANFDKLLSKEYELTQAETSFAELSQEEQRKRSREWAMLLAMAAMPAIDTALHGKSGTIYGNNIYDNLESQGTQDIYKGSTTSWKPPVEEKKLQWDSWQNYEKVTANGQEYAKIGDRLYSRHAVNRMQPSGNRFGINIYEGINGKDYGRSIAPQFVEDIIRSTEPVYQPRTGNYSYALGNVEVILNSQGAVVTILTYK